MLNKRILMDAMNSFPEHFTLHELVEHLVIVEKMKQKRTVKKSEVSVTEVDQEIEKWFKY